MNLINILDREVPMRTVAIVLMMSILSWTVGFSAYTRQAHAAMSFSSVSDTLGTSDASVGSSHVILLTAPNGLNTNDALTITFPAGFVLTALATSTDVSIFGGTCAGLNPPASPWGTWTPPPGCSQINNGSIAKSGQILTLTVGATQIAAGQQLGIVIGKNAQNGVNNITNPTAGAYNITLANSGSNTDSGDTWVVVLGQVVLSATVSSTFTFGVASVANSTTIGANTTTIGTTATTIPFGSLVAGTAVIGAQTLTATGNPLNGFAVTMNQDGSFKSQGKGVTIPEFNGPGIYNGQAGTSTPQTFAMPTLSVNDPATWAQIAIASDDIDVKPSVGQGSPNFAGDGSLWVGFNQSSNWTVMNATSSSDGSTLGNGLAHVFFQVKTTALQPAANDYQAKIRYVATPNF